MIRRPAPLVWLIASQTRTIRRLRRELAQSEQALRLANASFDRSQERVQRLASDNVMLGHMIRDPETAEAFLQLGRDIDELGVA